MSVDGSGVRRNIEGKHSRQRCAKPGSLSSLQAKRLEQTKEQLIAERTREMQQTFNRHDMLVREMFHLEHFKIMLDYDPTVAGKEESHIFNEYKSKFDLMNSINTPTTSHRRTRGANFQLKQQLGMAYVSSPAFPAYSVSRSPKAGRSRASRTFLDTEEQLNQPTVLSPAKRNDKHRSIILLPPAEVESSISSPSAQRRTTRQSNEAGTSKHSSLHFYDQDNDKSVEPSRKRRKLDGDVAARHRQSENDSLHNFKADFTPPDVPSPIKRVKLVVKRNDPLFTHAEQRPDPPKFGRSLFTFLSSYVWLDNREVSQQELDFRASKNARLKEKGWKLYESGRFFTFPDVSYPEHLKTSAPLKLKGSVDVESSDIWAQCTEQIVAMHERAEKEQENLEEKPPSGRELTGEIASIIEEYWGDHAVKMEKMKARDDKRLRALAKATMRMVIAEWKKAVFHIRTLQRQEQDAEELRRGREHLDAILDQSGHILETQHVDLRRRDIHGSRSISRSTSVDESEQVWNSSEERDHHDDSELEYVDEADAFDGRQELQLNADGGQTSEDADNQATYTRPVSNDDRSETASIVAVNDLVLSFSSPAAPPTQTLPLSSPSPSPQEILTNDTLFNPTANGTVNLEIPMQADSITLNSPAITHFDNCVIDSAGHGSSSLDVQTEGENEAVEQETFDKRIPEYLRPFAVAPVDWDPNTPVKPPILLRGNLRPYQQSGLEWLASLHANNLNGILADEMGLGKTIQTIALLAHLACDRGIWGPHLIIVPTSVLLNWEMEFKKFLPGFKILCYHGSMKRRKELRQGWSNKFSFNVCITSYAIASRDASILKRRWWYYMILDEAHMIKNFKSQRWNLLLLFRSFRRLLLTGTPLQNNLTELWALLQFLMSGSNFANLKEFGEWFSGPLERAIEMGGILDDEMLQRVSKLHTVLRPYLLRRLKRDVEKELPSKYEHLVLCPLSKRQRYLYDEFMSRAQTQNALQSGIYTKIANILMQLRKVCNHPDLFEIRPIITSFAMQRSAIADYENQELLIRRHRLREDEDSIDLKLLGLRFIDNINLSYHVATESRRLDATNHLPYYGEISGTAPSKDTKSIAGFKKYVAWQARASTIARWSQIGYINRLRLQCFPIIPLEITALLELIPLKILPFDAVNRRWDPFDGGRSSILSYNGRAASMASTLNKFAFYTPPVVVRNMPALVFKGQPLDALSSLPIDFDSSLHRAAVKLQIAFPDPSLLQFDCGKLQRLTYMLREKKKGGHRILIFTQMTRVLDILENFLTFHGYLYLRLDGGTKIEDRQYITERFNSDPRIFCFIASSRSGGVGINLTGADTVIFYDSDFNPQMDRQCEDRAHRIGQIRDVHIYRLVSEHTVEEALLRKANQKRSLNDIVIQKGQFDWRTLFKDDSNNLLAAFAQFEDTDDARAAAAATKEEVEVEGADENDFEGDDFEEVLETNIPPLSENEVEAEDSEGRSITDYMLSFIRHEENFFREWNI